MISSQKLSIVLTEVIRGILISKTRMVMAIAKTPSQKASRRVLDVSFTMEGKSIQLNVHTQPTIECIIPFADLPHFQQLPGSLRTNCTRFYFSSALIISHNDSIR